MLDSPLSSAWELTAIFMLLIVLVYLVVSTMRNSFAAVGVGEERFRKVFHTSPVAICLTALKDGKLIEANEAYWILTGFDPATSVGKSTVELSVWESESRRQEFIRTILERKSLHDPFYEFVNHLIGCVKGGPRDLSIDTSKKVREMLVERARKRR